jgi:hypothetical protein
MNIFDQSINVILFQLMWWGMKLITSCNTIVDTWHATWSLLKIESLLIIINHKNKWYFLIHNFKSFKFININSKIIMYLPKNWTICHIDYSHKTMIAHGILISFAIT